MSIILRPNKEVSNLKDILIKNIQHHFQKPGLRENSLKLVLTDVNLEVEQGQFVSIVGPSGCGKSTLLNIIGGLIKSTNGSILVDSKEIHGPGKDRGMVFQGYALLPWRTVLSNVELGLEINRVSKKERVELARKFINMVGLSEYEKYYPGQLSGGMKQRVAIARALAYNPKVLLMDEPFSALDAQTREILQGELLDIWAETKKTIIFVTHSVDEAVLLSNKIVVMGSNPGRIIKTLDVNLEYPRNQGAQMFQELRSQIWSEISEETSAGSINITKERQKKYEIA
jgi:NitT/TauT family transport system ATP-binding protein